MTDFPTLSIIYFNCELIALYIVTKTIKKAILYKDYKRTAKSCVDLDQ